jgi:hypothetical protein
LRSHETPPRGLMNTPQKVSYDGRFGRLFQGLADQPAQDIEDRDDVKALRELADAMQETTADASGDNERIPAGYTYLGQFVDHDITFDPTSLLDRRNDEEGLINFRTPRFDMDSVYGSGPQDEPFQYEKDSVRMLLRQMGEGSDLPRNEQGVALIGDPRNDENGIVSQLHVAFIAFQNAVLDQVASGSGKTDREAFEEAQRLAQWHYQWVVVHDFLRRLIGDELHNKLLTEQEDPDGVLREAVHLRYYRHKVNPYLPVEFSVAAYRFGHSQIRDEYSINNTFHRRLFDLSGDDFRSQPLRPGWHASWPFFFELDEQGPQLSRNIDTKLAPALFSLQGSTSEDANLAFRNLRRGAALGLPSGQAVAVLMKAPVLSDEQLAPAPPGRAPLWFYVLREAEVLHGGAHLGPVGGRIVGETLLGLLRADPRSYLRLEPEWRPTLPTRSGDASSFDMPDLLTVAVASQCRRF